MKQVILAVIAVVIIIFAGNFVVNKFYQPPAKPVVQQNIENFQQPVNESDNLETNLDEIISPIAEDISETTPSQTTQSETKEVVYKNSGYFPSTLTIKVSDTVVFKNESSSGMWTASATHPSHMVYSGASLEEHCPDLENIAFDECGSAQPGESWSFTFVKKGTWGYHNHVKPSHFGKITVE